MHCRNVYAHIQVYTGSSHCPTFALFHNKDKHTTQVPGILACMSACMNSHVEIRHLHNGIILESWLTLIGLCYSVCKLTVLNGLVLSLHRHQNSAIRAYTCISNQQSLKRVVITSVQLLAILVNPGKQIFSPVVGSQVKWPWESSRGRQNVSHVFGG